MVVRVSSASTFGPVAAVALPDEASSVADSLTAGKGESHEFTSLVVLSEFSLEFITILFVTFFVMFILILLVVGKPAGSESCGWALPSRLVSADCDDSVGVGTRGDGDDGASAKMACCEVVSTGDK